MVAEGKTFTLRFRINRNILECKARPVSPEPVPSALRINRNILECKERRTLI